MIDDLFAPLTEDYAKKMRIETLEEALARYFEEESVTPEMYYAELKDVVKGWRDYYAAYVEKAERILKLLEAGNESSV